MSDSEPGPSPSGSEEHARGTEEPSGSDAAPAASSVVPPKKKLSERKLRRYKEAYERKGVIYISRLPPHMKPGKVRQMLSVHGAISRIWCVPEGWDIRKRRKQAGGNTGKNFTEGWVEFDDKKVARAVAEMLNGQPMGGKRRSAYHFDLWCMKYLPKFKWDYLTEEIRYQNAIRQQRLAAEQAAAVKERDFYLAQVDKSKKLEAIAAQEARRAASRKDVSGSGGGESSAAPDAGPARTVPERRLRKVVQRRSKADPMSNAAAPQVSDGLLALVAGKRSRGEAAA